jgi:A/G-specific adenine glycosylase
MSPIHPAPIRRSLLGWYEKNKRDLPWRRTSDPYAIWISETMLQQTQVKTVLPYYERFMKALPTIAALNRAPLRRVLQLWSGLGYYRRAENLKKAAAEMMQQHGGTMPQDYDKLRALPGVGEYTAGAVLSIAFRKPYPAVDGNARRVLGRLFSVHDAKTLRLAAEQLVPTSKPGAFNQAVMELGATLCLPREPRCSLCPLARHCQSHNGNGAAKSPTPRNIKKFIDVIWPLTIVRHGGKILLRRRANRGLLSGLWELPGGERCGRNSAVLTIRQHLDDIAIADSPRRIGEIRHSITHRRIRSPVFLIELAGDQKPKLPDLRWRWVAPAALERYPLSSMTVKAARILASYEETSS